MGLDDYRPLDDNLLLWNRKEIDEANGNEIGKEIYLLLNDSKCNAFKQLQRWRKVGHKMLKWMKVRTEIDNARSTQFQRYVGDSSGNRYKRWSPDEEEALIEKICDGDLSILELSTVFGRSP